MSDLNLTELLNVLNEAGIKSVDDLRQRLSEDYAATAAWTTGYNTGFKYAHTMQLTMETCQRTLAEMNDFKVAFYEFQKKRRTKAKAARRK